MRQRAARGLVAVLAITLSGATGCASIFHSYDVAPNGLSRRDDTLRRLLADGHADTALARLGGPRLAPDDELLGLLYTGVAAHYAGRLDESVEALQRAGELTDDRVTRSVSRAALSVVSSDLVLPWMPLPSERLLVPYYAALGYLRAARPDEAAVEARRMGALLQRMQDDHTPLDPRLAGFLHLFSGEVFRAAGERTDAAVAFRNAQRLLGRAPDAAPADARTGEVIVLVEDGFVAHRVEESVTVGVLGDELEALERENDRPATATLVAGRVVAHLAGGSALWWTGRRRDFFVPAPRPVARKAAPPDCEPGFPLLPLDSLARLSRDTAAAARNGRVRRPPCPPGLDPSRRGRHGKRDPDDDPFFMRLAWPAYRLERPPAGEVLVLAGNDTVRAGQGVNLSDAVVADFERERPLIMARLVARAAAKVALSRSIEKSVSKKHETTGKLLGSLANIGALLTERADLRSWQLLPGRLSIVRLRLPPGTTTLAVQVPSGSATRRLELGSVEVKPGEVAFVEGRVWK